MLTGLLRTMRPHQWVKNLVVLAPLVFARELFDLRAAWRAGAAFLVFCLLAGAVYVLNDLVDVVADREHPTKKHRPIASGVISERQAKVALALLSALAISGSFALGLSFLLAALGYLALNLAYSFKLKQIAYIDLLCIAGGFELRVLGGSFAAEVPPSAYLLIVIFLGASFLGLGKRAHELAAMEDRAAKTGSKMAATRVVLGSYDLRVLTPLLYVMGVATVLTYIVYTLDPHTMQAFGTRWLSVTAFFTLFGVLRFTHLVRRRSSAESPTDAMLKDAPFLLNIGAWALCVLLVIYFT